MISTSEVTKALKRFLLPATLGLALAVALLFIPQSPAVSGAPAQKLSESSGDGANMAPAEPFCGWSTNGACQTDEDCFESGCSGEVCQSVHENAYNTICKSGDCYDAELYNIRCGCVNNACQWTSVKQ